MQSPMPLTTGASTALVSGLSVTSSPPLASTLSQTSAAGLLKRIAKPQADGPCLFAKSAANESGSSLSRKFTPRSEEHTSELQSLMSISYAVFCLKKKNNKQQQV